MTNNATKEAQQQDILSQQIQPEEIKLIEEKIQTTTSQITLKCGDSFLITDVSGDLLSSRQEMGLFRYGTRFLRTCNLFLQGRRLVVLSHQTSSTSNACRIDLTNSPLSTLDTDTPTEQGAIHVDRFITLEQDYLVQTLTVTSFQSAPLSTTLSLKADTDFCDLFEVRGIERAARGELLSPQYTRQEITLRYRGLDQIERQTQLQFDPPATTAQADRADWLLNLERGKPVQIRIVLKFSESNKEQLEAEPAVTLWREAQHPTITSNNPFFNQLLLRGMQDLTMLSTMTPYGYFPYAGIPWFNTPFGRDGLIAAFEFLPWYPQVAKGTLKFLAAYQGTKVEAFTDEEPGKILHEFRTGEMANCREIPYIPYYGTIDATPLFLILFEAYVRWTNDIETAREHWSHIQAAAHWIIDYGDRDGDSFIEYITASDQGLANQGWKDAWDSISHGDGRLAQSPKALSEVQGYAYAAYRAISYLARKLASHEEARFWDRKAEEIQANFLREYWWDEEQIVYQGLAAHKEPCDVVSSNAGQCLWTGILPDDKARQVIDRLMREDMFCGWGIRTLSTQAARYNPLSYHNGSVWPHDTALIGAGIALYGGKTEASQILKSLFDASQHFEDYRLPELYCGFARIESFGPTRYPVSCSPQAWATGAPIMLMTALLGMNPNAEEGRLTLHQPTLPDWLTTLEINGIYVGSHRVHLRFVRTDDHTEVILGKDNEVAIHII